LPLTRLLASRPAVAIGVLSYSWYLWHWPLVSFARSLDLAQAIAWKDVAASAAALALAVPTYWLVERPMQALRRRPLTPRAAGWIIAIGLGGSALIAAVALAALQSPSLEQSLSPQEMGGPSAALAGCREPASLPRFPNVQPCMVGPDGMPSVVVWGDSHADMLWPVAEWSAEQAGRTALVLGSPACPPFLGIDVQYRLRPPCSEVSQSIARWLEAPQPASVTGVVLASRWSLYDGEETPAVGSIEPLRLVWHDGRPATDFADMLATGLRTILQALSGRQRVLIVGPVPEFRHAAEDCALRAKLYAGSRASCAMRRADVDERGRTAMGVLQDVVGKFPDTMLIDPTDLFCDRTTCSPFGAAGVFYRDDNHLTPLGAEMFYRRFATELGWVFDAGRAR
jgi:hypothetical protein